MSSVQLHTSEAEATDWARYKALRLEMLSDSPRAFGDSLDDVSSKPDTWWQTRVRSQLMPDCGWFVVADDARWHGQMLTRIYGERVYLLEVYLSPAVRGSGVAQQLLQAAERWTKAQGYSQLWLDVNEKQQAARRFYERSGFVCTGERSPHSLFPEDYELEMVKELRSS